MGVSSEQLRRVTDKAEQLKADGYFGKVAEGSRKAASLFAKLTAFELNPSANPLDFGWLSKAPGEIQHDGFAEDAIVLGSDPADLMNVVDFINGAGAAGASIGAQVKPRRPHNKWVAPKPLTFEEVSYLRDGAAPPVPQPSNPAPGREEALDELNWLDGYYAARDGLQRPQGLSLNGKPDFEGVAAWYLDLYQKTRMAGATRVEARAVYVSAIRHSDEWKAKHPGETP